MPDAPSPTPAAPAPTSLAVSCVRALMERHGLAKYRQSAWLAEAIGLSYAQAHRRMNGSSPWTLEDLAHVAGLFGESLADLVSLGLPQSSVPAVMNVGGARVACQLWLGESVDKPAPGSVVAVKTSEGWAAVPAAEATDGVAYKIERIEARPVALPRKLIAVLDDDEDLTNSICAHFQASGYDARPFYRTADLLSAIGSQRYDAYVIDWIVGEKSTIKLIGSLRAQDATCPIVVLTAQVLSGVVDEADIADAVQRYGLVFSEKPVRTSILAATLTRALSGSES